MEPCIVGKSLILKSLRTWWSFTMTSC